MAVFGLETGKWTKTGTRPLNGPGGDASPPHPRKRGEPVALKLETALNAKAQRRKGAERKELD